MTASSAQAQTGTPGFGEAAALWLKVGLLSFGGAAGQIAMLHRVVVDERRWLDEGRFLHALNFCMVLPGPEAQQLATYIGWLWHGKRGGIVAGLLFVLPGALVMLALSLVYALFGQVPQVEAAFFGLKAAVLVIVIEAVLKIGRRALKTRGLVVLAMASFLAIAVLDAPFPLLIVTAACVAALIGPTSPALFALVQPDAQPRPPRVPVSETTRTIAIWTSVWAAPVVVAAMILGPGHVLVDIGLFFAKLASLTFGGAYALLAWLAQAAVETKHWLSPAEMVDGLGLAETTPGPTILVTQFVGFIAAMRLPAPFTPVLAGVLGAAMTTWVTFAPSFLLIFAAAPYVEIVRTNRRIAAALAAIGASVVGVVAYVAFWFGLHVLFAQVGEAAFGPLRLPVVALRSVQLDALALSAVAFVLLLVLHRGLMTTIAVLVALGIAFRAAGF